MSLSNNEAALLSTQVSGRRSGLVLALTVQRSASPSSPSPWLEPWPTRCDCSRDRRRQASGVGCGDGTDCLGVHDGLGDQFAVWRSVVVTVGLPVEDLQRAVVRGVVP
jgi:hypothetical protein